MYWAYTHACARRLWVEAPSIAACRGAGSLKAISTVERLAEMARTCAKFSGLIREGECNCFPKKWSSLYRTTPKYDRQRSQTSRISFGRVGRTSGNRAIWAKRVHGGSIAGWPAEWVIREL
jgi:hypothetical protein